MILSTMGFLFSGYMSGVKLFSKVCAFGETCPLFFGMPACYIGFVLFLSLFILSLAFILSKKSPEITAKKLLIVSTIGVIYSLYYAIPEILILIQNGFGAYFFGLPTCVLGSLFFVAIFIGSVVFYKKTKNK